QSLRIEASRLSGLGGVRPRVRHHHLAHGHQVSRSLGAEARGDIDLALRYERLKRLFLRADFRLLGSETLHFRLGDEWVFGVARRREYAAESVVVLLRDRVVLVVVAARARHRESEKALREGVDLVVAFGGAGLGEDNVVAGKPGAKPEEAESG